MTVYDLIVSGDIKRASCSHCCETSELYDDNGELICAYCATITEVDLEDESLTNEERNK